MIYREKAAACELLEGCIKLVIGKTPPPERKEDWSAQYRHLFPAMLRLATDVDSFARSLFAPLTMQTIHWLTAHAPLPAVTEMLEAIMGTISNERHAGLREFGARCLGECIRYAIKHQQPSTRDSPLAVTALLARLYGLAHHPNPIHRLGFAFALNSPDVYREMREDSATLDVHVLEMVRHTLRALRLAEDDPPALGSVGALGSVLEHLQRMMLRPAICDALVKRNDKRIAFRAGLQAFTKWLFQHCVQPRAHARLAACQLFAAITARLAASGSRRAAPCDPKAASREWVLSFYGTRLGELPICQRLDASSAATGVRVSKYEGGADPVGDAEDESDEAEGVRGTWARLTASVPPSDGDGASMNEDGAREPSMNEDGAAMHGDGTGGQHGAQRAIMWLGEVQAALDSTFWTLDSRHLTSEALLSPTGSLRAIHPLLHALLRFVLQRAPAAGVQVFTEVEEQVLTRLRDALKAAFRLIKHLVREAPPGRALPERLHAFLEPPPLPDGGAAARSCAGGAACDGDDASPARVALLAALRPTRCGFDASQIESCGRMRRLACELYGLLHVRQPDEMVAKLSVLLRESDANLQAIELLSPSTEALEVMALLDGHLELLEVAERSLLRHALPHGAETLAERLTAQVCSAPTDASPLEMQILSKALSLTFSIGTSTHRVLGLMQDGTVSSPHGAAGLNHTSSGAHTTGRSTSGAATRGELLCRRFRATLLPHLARDPAAFGPVLMLSSPASHPFLFELLLALLTWHLATPEQPAEPLVRTLIAHLPAFLAMVAWPHGLLAATAVPPAATAGRSGARDASASAVGSSAVHSVEHVVSMFRLLLQLGGHLVLTPPSALLDSLVSLLVAACTAATSSGDQRGIRAAERVLADALRLLPLLLRWLRPAAGAGESSGLDTLVMALRRVLQTMLPLSFTEIANGDRKRRASAILTPLLDAIASDHSRPLPLLRELLALPALTEQQIDGNESTHPFAEGVLTATARAVDAAVRIPANSDGVTAAAEAWATLCHPALADEPSRASGVRGRWDERLCAMRWIGLPLLLKAPPGEVSSASTGYRAPHPPPASCTCVCGALCDRTLRTRRTLHGPNPSHWLHA